MALILNVHHIENWMEICSLLKHVIVYSLFAMQGTGCDAEYSLPHMLICIHLYVQVCSNGAVKVLDRLDGSGAGDVDTSVVVQAAPGDSVTGVSGRTLKVTMQISYSVSIRDLFCVMLLYKRYLL